MTLSRLLAGVASAANANVVQSDLSTIIVKEYTSETDSIRALARVS
jgi:hypothetical protein